jgi:hypothetical protein
MSHDHWHGGAVRYGLYSGDDALTILSRRHQVYNTALARGAFGGTVHALCRWRRTMACTITSLFLIAMFGIIAAGLAFRPKEKPSAQRQETPVAPSGDRAIA